MNHIELTAIRRFLFFTQQEAAEMVGNVPIQTWIEWETAVVTAIPEDVESALLYLCEWRRARIAKLILQDYEQPLIWYKNFFDYCQANPDQKAVCWRPEQSAIAELVSNGGRFLS